MQETLMYQQPAAHWCEALPLGNGRIGGMVFGGIGQERIALNEDTLWTGHPSTYSSENAISGFQEARDFALKRAYRQAQNALERDTLGMWSQIYLPLGDLWLDFEHKGQAYDYQRTLSLDRALHTTAYRVDGVSFKRECFVSAPHQALIMRISADAPQSVSLHARLENQLQATLNTAEALYVMEGRCPAVKNVPLGDHINTSHYHFNDPECIGYRTVLHAVCDGGSIDCDDSGLKVHQADALTLILTVRTSFTRFDQSPALTNDYLTQALEDAKLAANLPYDTLLNAHIQEHRQLYRRVSFNLDGAEANAHIPTDKRLEAHTGGAPDIGLYKLLFDYGRYLMIASSRQGTQPSNLQGIWNDRLQPPWNSNYTVNINTQMNYWPAHGLNLLECEEPLVRMVSELTQSGQITAKNWYGARGFTCHHNTDLWRLTSPVGHGTPGSAQYAAWPMAGGWFVRHLWKRYQHSGDLSYLKEQAYPAVREAALFFMDMLVEDQDGTLIFAPSTSPENSFLLPDGSPSPVAATTTMTTSIVRDVFTIYCKCAALLNLQSDPSIAEIQALLERLKPYATGADGRLLEWSEALPERELTHRHVSHLYGLYPGEDIAPGSAMAEACRLSLDTRSDEGTGWSLAWKVNLRARLGQGDHALGLIDRQLRLVSPEIQGGQKGGSYPNLLCAHPPFQIDGNFGVVAGILNMLIQCDSYDDVRFLPALPSNWPDGQLTGVRIHGNRCVDMAWRDGVLTRANINPCC